MQLFNRNDVEPFVGDDGSIVRELASPGIRASPGTALPRSATRRAPPARNTTTPRPRRSTMSSRDRVRSASTARRAISVPAM